MPDDPYEPLFTSDLAQQVRETFEEIVSFGGTVNQATQETVHRYEGLLADEREGPVVILALAALQLGHAEIDLSIRDAALGLLQSGEARKAMTAEPGARKQIAAVLADLQEELESIEVEEDDDDDEEEEDGDEEE